MAEQRYSVLLESEVGYGGDPEAVKEELSSLGLLSPEDIERLMSGKPVVLQRGLSHEQALRYQEALEAAGARSRLVAAGPEPAPSATQPLPSADTRTPHRPTGSSLSADDMTLAPAPDGLETWMTCPRCGVNQVEAAECSACGVIVSKFAERTEAGVEAPWARREHEAPVDEEDLYQGPAQTRSPRRGARPDSPSFKDLTIDEALPIFAGALTRFGRKLLTAAKIAGSSLYHQGRRALAWLGDQIRTRLAERRAAQSSKKQQGAGHDEPGT